MIRPDGMRGGWDSIGVSTPGVLDMLLEFESRHDDWADDLVNAIEAENRRQVLKDRCPPGQRDIVACLRAGQTTGRGARTEKNAIREIRAAVRSLGPRQREMFDVGDVPPTPRPPTRRGRTKSKTRSNQKKIEKEQGVLV